MRKWLASSFIVTLIITVLVAAFVAVFSVGFPEQALTIAIVGVLLAPLASFIVSLALMNWSLDDVVKTLWSAAEDSATVLFALTRDGVVKVIRPEILGQMLLKFKLDGRTVYFLLHPQSVLPVEGGKSRAVFVHPAIPASLPANAIIAAMDVKARGYPHVDMAIISGRQAAEREKLKTLYRQLVENIQSYKLATNEHERNNYAREIMKNLATLGYSLKTSNPSDVKHYINDIEVHAQRYLSMLEEAEKLAKSDGSPSAVAFETLVYKLAEKFDTAPRYLTRDSMLTLTPDDLEAIADTIMPVEYVRHIFEWAEAMIALEKAGRGPQINWRLLLMLGALLLIALVIINVLQKGGIALPNILPLPAPTPAPTPGG